MGADLGHRDDVVRADRHQLVRGTFAHPDRDDQARGRATPAAP
jgi:hypothetical protein